MEKFGVRAEVIEEICGLAKKNHIRKVILFGSRARGDYHRASDIDLAVWGGDVLNFSLDVEERTSTLLTYDVVDLGMELQAAFRESIEKEGIVLYEEI